MKKKFTLFLIASLILVGLIGCGMQKNNTPVSSDYDDIHSTQVQATPQPTSIPKRTVTDVISKFNSKMKSEWTDLSSNEIESVLFSLNRTESHPEKNVTSYEYCTPNNAIGICLFENMDTKEISFGNIEINKGIISSQNQNDMLQGFMDMCYFLTYALDSTTEDEFMEIWRLMRGNEDSIAVYPKVTYQIQEYDDYLMFAFSYTD